MANYFLGTITEVLDPDIYHIKADIPGLAREVEAYPIRGELDEPRVGDQILVRDIDPIFHSFYLYSEIKEDKFIGIRSRGKMIQFTEDELNISIFNSEETYETSEDEIPKEIKAFVKIKKDGNIEISNKDSDSGKVEVNIKDSTSIDIGSTFTISVTGNATISSPNVTIEGGVLNVKGSVDPIGGGPFCAIPVCPITGAPHVGPRVNNT